MAYFQILGNEHTPAEPSLPLVLYQSCICRNWYQRTQERKGCEWSQQEWRELNKADTKKKKKKRKGSGLVRLTRIMRTKFL